MASANKFATALHRNTNRMTLVLVYALLEWILITLLLAHSLFALLILRFADYFGLQPPCPLCSSFDHLFRPGRGRTIALCRNHLEGISRGWEFAGREDASEDRLSSLVDFGKQVSENGLASRIEWPCDVRCNRPRNVNPPDYSSDDHDSLREVSSMKNGFRDNWEKEEEDEEEWGELRLVNVGVTEACEKIRAEEEEENLLSPDSVSSGIMAMVSREIDQEDLGTEEEREVAVQSDKNVGATVDSSVLPQPDQISLGIGRRKDESFGTNPQHLEFYIGNDESELIPVDLKEWYTVGGDDLQNFRGDVILELCTLVEKQCEEGSLESARISFHEIEADDFWEMKTIVDALRPEMVEDNVEEEYVLEKAVVAQEETKAPVSFNDLKVHSEATGRHEHPQNHPAIAEEEEEDEEEEMEEKEQSQDEERDVEVSIGTEIPDHETVNEVFVQEVFPSFEGNHENFSTSYESGLPQTEPHSGCVQSETATLEFKTLVVEMCELGLSHLQLMCKDKELNHELEEYKIPDTPASTDSLGVLHSILMLRDNRTVGTEGSMEGSLVSDIEGGDEDLTMEQLKETLKEERRSLHALYAELEEERNASAIAASQTMAMINRLQEEKAAMQMEAVQYQRMMEEQSEYDQEALQLLNDVVVKTEKEKEELARELEVCCQRLEEYEATENVTIPGGNEIRQNSEYSEPEDVDENENTPCDAVACLEETIVDFEEERLCILEHIKALEEKLVIVAKHEDDPRFEDVRVVATCLENCNGDLNHVPNDEIGENVSKHRRNGIIGAAKAKRLVPLFDMITEEDGCELQPRYEDEHTKTEEEEEEERLAVEEELDYVYERLDALEADGEFLRHCMGSMKKGEKGLDILREILQYLRDMRCSRD